MISGNLWKFLKEVNPLVMFSVKIGMSVELMQVNRISSQVDLGYTEHFCVAPVTSGAL